MKRLSLLIVVVLGSILLSSISAYPQSTSQPTRFEFFFNGPARGMRMWSRSGDMWTETYSSGQTGTFRVRKTFHLKGTTGMLVQKVDEKDFFVFVPNLDSPKMEVWTYKSNGPWKFLAKMDKVGPQRID